MGSILPNMSQARPTKHRHGLENERARFVFTERAHPSARAIAALDSTHQYQDQDNNDH